MRPGYVIDLGRWARGAQDSTMLVRCDKYEDMRNYIAGVLRDLRRTGWRRLAPPEIR